MLRTQDGEWIFPKNEDGTVNPHKYDDGRFHCIDGEPID